MIFKKIENLENVEVICHYLSLAGYPTSYNLENGKSSWPGLMSAGRLRIPAEPDILAEDLGRYFLAERLDDALDANYVRNRRLGYDWPVRCSTSSLHAQNPNVSSQLP